MSGDAFGEFHLLAGVPFPVPAVWNRGRTQSDAIPLMHAVSRRCVLVVVANPADLSGSSHV